MNNKYITLAVFSVLILFASCDLVRDNPLDGKNNDGSGTTKAQIIYNSYSVFADNNGDGVVNKGETVELKISLKNTGTRAAKGVKATFSAGNDVSGLTPTGQITYGDIPVNTVMWADYSGYNSVFGINFYTIRFTVSNTTPVGTQIPININIADESGNTWTSSFNVPVTATYAQIGYNSYSVYSDDNSDGTVNTGETVGLKISLKNTGTSVAKAVKATFSTTNTYVSGLTPTGQISYGDISANSVMWADYLVYTGPDESNINTYTIQFTVSNTAPAGTEIPIDISIVDESGNTWTTSFTVTVEATAAQIAYNSFSVYSDGNEDGTLNPGETVGLKISLKNTGTSTAKAVKATFSTTSSYVSGLTPTGQLTYGDISANSVKWADYSGYSGANESDTYNYTISFAVSNTTPAGTEIPIDISIVDERSNTWTASFNVTVTATTAQIAYNSHSSYSNGTSETVELKVSLKNTGTSTAKDVKATFSTDSWVSGFSPTTQITYGDISANSVKWADCLGYSGSNESDINTYTIQFAVSAGTEIPINISIVDESGNTWAESFNVIVTSDSSCLFANLAYGICAEDTIGDLGKRNVSWIFGHYVYGTYKSATVNGASIPHNNGGGISAWATHPTKNIPYRVYEFTYMDCKFPTIIRYTYDTLYIIKNEYCP